MVVESPKVRIKKVTKRKQESRESSVLFELPPIKTQTKLKRHPKDEKVFTYSGLKKSSIDNLQKSILELGGSRLERKFTNATTHLILEKPYEKTEKVLLAIIRGIWIVDIGYVTASRDKGSWDWEEPYELQKFLPAIGMTRADRDFIGNSYRLTLLRGINVFVDPKVKNGVEVIKNLVTLLGGRIVGQSAAKYIISDTASDGVSVSPLWLSDSISEGFLKSAEKYFVQR